MKKKCLWMLPQAFNKCWYESLNLKFKILLPYQYSKFFGSYMSNWYSRNTQEDSFSHLKNFQARMLQVSVLGSNLYLPYNHFYFLYICNSPTINKNIVLKLSIFCINWNISYSCWRLQRCTAKFLWNGKKINKNWFRA